MANQRVFRTAGVRRVVSSGTPRRQSASKRGLSQTRRAVQPDPEEDEEQEPEEPEETNASFEEGNSTSKATKSRLEKEDLDRLVKNFVRYALACEFTRIPLRRDEISRKVLEGKYSRSFNIVFDYTQLRLQSVFRMRLVELPAKEKHQTIHQQRRNANAKSAPPTKSWILTSTLPDHIRTLPNVLDPGDDTNDTVYEGIVTVIVTLVYLNGGILSEGASADRTSLKIETLTRYLRNLSIEDNTPLMSTDKLLKEMVKQGYIDKVKDMSSGEARYDYHLGPRGKVEVGEQGTMDFVKKIFGDDMNEILEKRIERSLADLKIVPNQDDENDEDGPPRKRSRQESEEAPRRGIRSRRQDDDAPRPRGRGSRQVEDEEEEEVEEEQTEDVDEDRPARRRGGGRGRGNNRGRGGRGTRTAS